MTGKKLNLLHTVEAFAGRKILVLGEAMLDNYLRGTSQRLCPEAPVPVVDIQDIISLPGGAANTAVNLRSLGADVAFLSVMGTDAEASTLLAALEERSVTTEHILHETGRQTLAKQRIVASSQVLVRFDQGTTLPLPPTVEAQFISRLEALFLECEAVVISDYSYGVLTPRILETLANLQDLHPRLVVVDSKRPGIYRDVKPTVIKLNYQETLQVLGLEKLHQDGDRIRQIKQKGGQVLETTGAQIAAITLDHNGAFIFHAGDETPYRTYAQPRPDSQAAGAGDTFVSALAISLAAEARVEQAAELASAAAAIVVSKSGTSACSVEELMDYFSTHEKMINDHFQLALRVAFYRRMGRRIVFTNGCFDILHGGHVSYLNRAKALGDVLIVGLNSDASIRRLKGPDRPINSLEERAQILGALSCVDHTIAFDEDTPHELIASIHPDVFAKGGDYTRATLPEAGLVEQFGGRVEILPYLENHSTTNVIERIRSTFAGESERRS